MFFLSVGLAALLELKTLYVLKAYTYFYGLKWPLQTNMVAEGFSFLIGRFLNEARKQIFKVTLVMLIGLSYIFPVI